MTTQLREAIAASVDEGARRLHRTTSSLVATGLVGGIDVGVGVFALFLVKTQSDNDLAAGLAFGIGFLALTLAGSELFTENFLHPITAVSAGRGRLRDIARLWTGTAVFNLVGGYLMMLVLTTARDDVSEAALRKGGHFFDQGLSFELFMSAILAGIIITLMTWMQSGTVSTGAEIVTAFAAAFLLAYGELGHVVVASIEMFAAIRFGDEHSYLDWLPLFGLMAVGNLVGGVGLVTVLRMVQVGMRPMGTESVDGAGPPPPSDAVDEPAVIAGS